MINIKTILAAIEKDSTIVVKLAPVATQAYGVYEQYQGAKTDGAKLGALAQGATLLKQQNVDFGDVAVLLTQAATASA